MPFGNCAGMADWPKQDSQGVLPSLSHATTAMARSPLPEVLYVGRKNIPNIEVDKQWQITSEGCDFSIHNSEGGSELQNILRHKKLTQKGGP